MSGLVEALRKFFSGEPPKKKERAKTGVKRVRSGAGAVRGPSSPPKAPGRKALEQAKVEILQDNTVRPPIPYWVLRGWRSKGKNVYLGYFKTRLGRCHGVIKWNSSYDFGIYVHDVPRVILDGPHGACFAEVKPGKFRVHFAERPRDINSAIFYIETLLQEAFENE
ncbi:MAG: hypothetical protein JSV16_09400 [Candidatus Hydrogenedentota bacterium]|nr:MAG: hypothetical protein JSV16_09400 [Candidatus Hydrogenedentota bacterium]